MLVMVVDTDVATRQLVRFLLHDMGHDVVECQNGAEALQYLAGTKMILPDLVLLDTGLPLVSGREVARRLHADARGSHIPIVLTSTITTKQAPNEDLKLGVIDTLFKPFDIGTFRRSITSALRGSQHE